MKTDTDLANSLAAAAQPSQVLAVDVAEAARVLSVSRSKVYSMLAAREIPSFKIRGTSRVSLTALANFIGEQEAKPLAAKTA